MNQTISKSVIKRHRKFFRFISKHGDKVALLFILLFSFQLFFSGKEFFPDWLEKAINVFVAIVALFTIQIELLNLKFDGHIGKKIYRIFHSFIVLIPIYSLLGYMISENLDAVYEYCNLCSSFLGVASYFLFAFAQSKTGKGTIT